MKFHLPGSAVRMDLMLSPRFRLVCLTGNSCPSQLARARGSLLALGLAVVLALLLVPACKRAQRTDTRPLDQAGMWFNSVEELRQMEITGAEVAELAKARQSGLSDAGCLELMRMARGRKQPFASGDAIVNLRRVDVSEATILELARLDQLGLWVGEAQAMRLAGFSDHVLLAIARRRAAGQTVLSGPSLMQLKNAGLSEADVLGLIARGTTDEQAAQMVAAHRRAITPSGFVRQRGRRPR